MVYLISPSLHIAVHYLKLSNQLTGTFETGFLNSYISKMKSKLAIFDFDHTIKNPRKGWQMGVSHFFPDGEIPEDIHQIRKEQGWDSFCIALYTKVIH